MNDYTNLIYQLRECAEAQDQELLRQAADAIERLCAENYWLRRGE